MAKGQKRSNKEVRKPKKGGAKLIAPRPTQKPVSAVVDKRQD